MINLKEIENRKYDGKVPISFEYTIKGLEGPRGEVQELRVWFEKVSHDYNITDNTVMINNKPTYRIFTIINDIVYQKIYMMPKKEMPLEIIVATGLSILRLSLLEDANQKEMIGYTIGDIIKDM